MNIPAPERRLPHRHGWAFLPPKKKIPKTHDFPPERIPALLPHQRPDPPPPKIQDFPPTSPRHSCIPPAEKILQKTHHSRSPPVTSHSFIIASALSSWSTTKIQFPHQQPADMVGHSYLGKGKLPDYQRPIGFSTNKPDTLIHAWAFLPQKTTKDPGFPANRCQTRLGIPTQERRPPKTKDSAPKGARHPPHQRPRAPRNKPHANHHI